MKNERPLRPAASTTRKLYAKLDSLESEVTKHELNAAARRTELEYALDTNSLLRKNLKTVSSLSAFLAFLILVNLILVIKHNLAYHGNIVASKGHR